MVLGGPGKAGMAHRQEEQQPQGHRGSKGGRPMGLQHQRVSDCVTSRKPVPDIVAGARRFNEVKEQDAQE